MDLWSLLPHFCASDPSDVREALPHLTSTLVRALGDGRYPQLLTVACVSLRALVSVVKGRAEQRNRGRRGGEHDDDVAADQKDLEALGEASAKILPTLFRAVETLHNTDTNAGKKKGTGTDEDGAEDGMDVEAKTGKSGNPSSHDAAQRVPAVADAIGELASVCPGPFLSALFKKVVQRLLIAVQKSGEEEEDDDDGDMDDDNDRG